MTSKVMNLIRYDADEGMVFDWKDLSAHTVECIDGSFEQEHLYVKTIYIGELDSIDNYVEVEAI